MFNLLKTKKSDFFDSFIDDIVSSMEVYHSPKMDIIDNDESSEIIAEVPGMNKDDIKIEFNEDVLTISGNKIETNQEAKYLMRERNTSSFKRSFTVSEYYDVDNIDAEYKQGILKISIPKKKETKKLKRKIEIR